jgi:hypothetical protein
MNNKYAKSSLKALVILFLSHPHLIKPIQAPWYQKHFHVLEGREYAENCMLITMAQYVRGAALLAYYRTTHRKADLHKALSLIQNQITEFERYLLTAESDALIAIKEKYQVTDKIWQQCLAEMQHIKNSYKNGMLQEHPDVTHDPNVPADIREILTTLLQQNGINPQSVNLKMITDQTKINDSTHYLAQARSFILITSDAQNNTFTLYSDYIPSVIEIFPRMIELSANDKMSTCAHEIQHLIQHHSLTELILIKYLLHHYDVNISEFKKSPEYHTLSQIHEAQAEILSAVKNPEIAACLKKMRKNKYYPHHLYEEHFLHLSSIDMLFKVHGWLEFIHQDGFGKIRNEWYKKIKESVNSIKQLLT